MPYKPNQTRDIYHGELLDLREDLSRRTPPIPFAAGMIQILRWFAALSESEKTRILTTEPSPTERYVTQEQPSSRDESPGTAASDTKEAASIQSDTCSVDFCDGDPADANVDCDGDTVVSD